MATAEAALKFTPEGVVGERSSPCEWETVVGPCHGLHPRNVLREIVFYDGRLMLICPNHFKVWERERGLYIKHIRIQ
jgi:hypothetical protein